MKSLFVSSFLCLDVDCCVLSQISEYCHCCIVLNTTAKLFVCLFVCFVCFVSTLKEVDSTHSIKTNNPFQLVDDILETFELFFSDCCCVWKFKNEIFGNRFGLHSFCGVTEYLFC
jgi:hypothetical protein